MHVPLPRRLAAAAALAALTAAVAGCGSPAPALVSTGPRKPHLIVAAVRAADEVPLHITQQRGVFRQRGLDVTLAALNTSTAAVPRLVNASIDVLAGASYVSSSGAQARGALQQVAGLMREDGLLKTPLNVAPLLLRSTR